MTMSNRLSSAVIGWLVVLATLATIGRPRAIADETADCPPDQLICLSDTPQLLFPDDGAGQTAAAAVSSADDQELDALRARRKALDREFQLYRQRTHSQFAGHLQEALRQLDHAVDAARTAAGLPASTVTPTRKRTSATWEAWSGRPRAAHEARPTAAVARTHQAHAATMAGARQADAYQNRVKRFACGTN